NADTIILGCTHYPFLSQTIRIIVGKEIRLIETGRPVARQLQRILQQHYLLNNCDHTGEIRFYNSSHLRQHKNTMQQLWLGSIQILPLPI
ncbi:MAG TPA: glutamate racemase, partial [Leucothrix mucor]|nr:glutamate racemase [Leucothrix mucor]